jgi:UDP-N-acetylmuramoyl-tripeptide--D-alanyl-D-alanine ligase
MKALTMDEVLAATRGTMINPRPASSVRGVSTDSRTVQPGQLFFALIGPHHDGHNFIVEALRRGAVGAVVSRRDSATEEATDAGIIIAVDDTTAALGRLAAYHRRQLAAQIVAVTGSNGKTTTKDMIHAVLSAARKGRCSPRSFNNHVGVPLTLLSAEGSDEYLVVEIGSNAPGEVHALSQIAKPDVAVITGISPTHLQGLSSIEGVAEEKASLLRSLRRGGLAALNIDHPALMRHLPDNPDHWRQVGFGLVEGADLRATDVQTGADGISFRVNDKFEIRLNMLGRHNAVNALAAVAVGRRFGLEHEQIAGALATVSPPPMRLQLERIGPITVINDAYNANPESMGCALEVLMELPATGRRVAVLGDMRELGEQSQALHVELGRRLGRSGVQLLVAVGDYADVVSRTAARDVGDRLEVRSFADVGDAMDQIAKLLAPADMVLVKGSRAMQLERLMEPIRRHFGAPGREPAAEASTQP